MSKELAFSLKSDAFEWEYKRGSGKGGQAVNKTSSAVRVVHRDSGAVGQASDTRSQLQNRKLALKRLTETAQFKVWVNRELMLRDGLPTAEFLVEKDMQSHNLRVEVKKDGKWVVEEVS